MNFQSIARDEIWQTVKRRIMHNDVLDALRMGVSCWRYVLVPQYYIFMFFTLLTHPQEQK
jgi:hypothetical protein